MARHVRLREILVAVEGLAVLRGMLDGDDEAAVARIEEVRRIVGHEEETTFGAGFDAPELGVVQGYGAWAATYDRPGNPVVAVEQPVVWSLLDGCPRGRALDAACGTGRHSRRLAELGHEVVGVDATPEMLLRARAATPGVYFVRGDLGHLPMASATVDLAVCALALDHAPDLRKPVMELARVVRPGGRVVISDVHPVLSALGVAALFQAEDGSRAYVRNYRHVFGEYLDAFAGAGLEVRRCLEPRYGLEEVGMQGIAMRFAPDAARAAFLGLPAVLVWDLAVTEAAHPGPRASRPAGRPAR
jgi:SAM-dependent methyltransferase